MEPATTFMFGWRVRHSSDPRSWPQLPQPASAASLNAAEPAAQAATAALLGEYVAQWTATLPEDGTDAGEGSGAALPSVAPAAMLNALLVSLPPASEPPPPSTPAEATSGSSSAAPPPLRPITAGLCSADVPAAEVASQLLRHSRWLATGTSHAAGPAPRLASAALVSHAYTHGLAPACAALGRDAAGESPTGGAAVVAALTAQLPWMLPLGPAAEYRGAHLFLLFHPMRVVRVWARDSLLRLVGAAATGADDSRGGGDVVVAALLRVALQLLCTLKHLSTLPGLVSFLAAHPRPAGDAAMDARGSGNSGERYVVQERVHTFADGVFHVFTILTAWDAQVATATTTAPESLVPLLGRCRATVLLLGGSMALYGLQAAHNGIRRAVMDAWQDHQLHHPLQSAAARVDPARAAHAALTQLLMPLNALLAANPRMPRAGAVTAAAVRKAVAKALVHCLLDNASGLVASREEAAWRRGRLEWLWSLAAALEPPTPRVTAPLLADPLEGAATAARPTSARGGDGVGGSSEALVWVPERSAGWVLRPLLKNAAQQLRWTDAMATAKMRPGSGPVSDPADDAVRRLDRAVHALFLLLDTAAAAVPRLLCTTYFHDTIAAHELALLTLAIGGIMHTRTAHALGLHRLLVMADVRAFAAGAAAQAQGAASATGARGGAVGVPTVCLQRVWLTLPTLLSQMAKAGASSSNSTSPLASSEVLVRLCGTLTELVDAAAAPCAQWLLASGAGPAMAMAPAPLQEVVQCALRGVAQALLDHHGALHRVWLGLPATAAEAACVAAASSAASRAVTHERAFLRLLFALRLSANAELRRLGERLAAVFCVGVTDTVGRMLTAEAAEWLWREVVLAQPDVCRHAPLLPVHDGGADASAAAALLDMNDAGLLSAARAQAPLWLVVLREGSWDQRSAEEVQRAWWLATLLVDVAALDVEGRRDLAERVLLALPTAPMLAADGPAAAAPWDPDGEGDGHGEAEGEGEGAAVAATQRDGLGGVPSAAQRCHAVVRRLFTLMLHKAEQYPRASLARLLLHISHAIPPAAAARDTVFLRDTQPLLVRLGARQSEVQQRLAADGPAWVRRGVAAAGQTMQECLAEQERRFRQFEVEEATQRHEEATAAQSAAVAERLRQGNEARRVAELARERHTSQSSASATLNHSRSSTSASIGGRTADGPQAATRQPRQQQLTFPCRPLHQSESAQGPWSVTASTSAEAHAVVELDVDSDVGEAEADASVARLLDRIAGSAVLPTAPPAPSASSSRSSSPDKVPPALAAPSPARPPTQPRAAVAPAAASAPAPSILQQKLQAINARNTHRVHHAEQLRQLQDRLRLVATSTNLTHLQPPLIHDIVGATSQCMATEVPVLPEVFVPAAEVLPLLHGGGGGATAAATGNSAAPVPFGDAAGVYAVRFAPHIALELRYDVVRSFEEFMERSCKPNTAGGHGSCNGYTGARRRLEGGAGRSAPAAALEAPATELKWTELLPLHPNVPCTCVAVQTAAGAAPAASRRHNLPIALTAPAAPPPLGGGSSLRIRVQACANAAVQRHERQQREPGARRGAAAQASVAPSTQPPRPVDTLVLNAATQGLPAVLAEGDVVAVLLPLHAVLARWLERELGCPLAHCTTAEAAQRARELVRTLPRSWQVTGCAVQVCYVESMLPGERAATLVAAPAVVERATHGRHAAHPQPHVPTLRFLHVFRMAFDTTAPSATFYLAKLTSLNASLMELEALHSIDSTRFAATLYDPRHTAPQSTAFYDWATSLLSAAGPLRATPLLPVLRARLLLQQQLNDWQIRAVTAVLYAVCPRWDGGVAEQVTQAVMPRAPEVLMIEGPPGTGKTQTIGSLTLNLVHHLSRVRGTAPRVLVCAPSNCAVDEALRRVVRLREQLSEAAAAGGEDAGVTQRPAQAVLSGGLLRIGVRDKVDAEVLAQPEAVFFDDVVEEMLESSKAASARGGRGGGGGAAAAAERGGRSGGGSDVRGADSGNARARQVARAQALSGAVMIFSTLGSLHHVSRTVQGFDFDVVVVDEASQGTEPAVLQAITLAKHKCVLVGDSRQLQPTILSPEASRCGLRRSLLVRLLSCGHRSFMLRTQYRMHPDIVAFPNAYFYDSQLLTDRSVRVRSRVPVGTAAAPHAATIAQRLGLSPRFVFVDVANAQMERRGGRSLQNPREAAAVVDVMRQLRTFFAMSLPEMAERVGVITFYAAQKSLIMSMLSRQERESGVQVATVDSFQGKEKRIVLLSCVRTVSAAQLRQAEQRTRRRPRDSGSDDGGGPGEDATDTEPVVLEERRASWRAGRFGLGFLADWHRLNVALTRAQDLCICFGSASTLRAVGMAALTVAAPTHCCTTADSSVEEVARQLDAEDEDPLALFRMLEHAEARDAALPQSVVAAAQVSSPPRADSIEVVEEPLLPTSTSRTAFVTYNPRSALIKELTARAVAAQAQSRAP